MVFGKQKKTNENKKPAERNEIKQGKKKTKNKTRTFIGFFLRFLAWLSSGRPGTVACHRSFRALSLSTPPTFPCPCGSYLSIPPYSVFCPFIPLSVLRPPATSRVFHQSSCLPPSVPASLSLCFVYQLPAASFINPAVCLLPSPPPPSPLPPRPPCLCLCFRLRSCLCVYQQAPPSASRLSYSISITISPRFPLRVASSCLCFP